MEPPGLTTVAVIPARGGSKGIPRKNIKPLAGHPLLYWTCNAASSAKLLDATYVATDDDEIRRVVVGFGLPRVHVIERAEHTATDTASTESVMLDCAGRVAFDRLVLIQATSPLLRSEDIDAAVRLVASGEFDSALSVVRQHRFLWRATGRGVSALNYDPAKRPRRQDWSGELFENGAVYVTTREGLERTGCRLSGNVGYVEMDEASYIELDSAVDWDIVEHLMRARALDSNDWRDRARRIRLVATDVDGCLTDSGMYYSEHGDELKKFNTRDGKAFELLRNAGIVTGIVTAENTQLLEQRAQKMRVDEVRQGALNKLEALGAVLERHGIAWEEAAFLGDDLGDVEVLRRVGLSACPADAVREAREACTIRLQSEGGRGALREFAELILAARA